MSQKPLTPNRKHLLEALVKCIRRAEGRIKTAGRIANGGGMHTNPVITRSERVQHMQAQMRQRGFRGYSLALARLQFIRSKYAAELEGLPWN
jgi:hypothetical protein